MFQIFCRQNVYLFSKGDNYNKMNRRINNFNRIGGEKRPYKEKLSKKLLDELYSHLLLLHCPQTADVGKDAFLLCLFKIHTAHSNQRCESREGEK